jgi:NADPH2:quinone reductase
VRAAVCRAYGGPEVVRVEEMPVPELAAGQVRVAVRAAAVNFPDVLLVGDRYQITVAPPFVPGSEFAGEVTEVADGIVGVAVGDRVAGTVMVGAFAEEVTVAARERQAEWSAVVFASEDAMEGARAYMEKRDPVWRGR